MMTGIKEKGMCEQEVDDLTAPPIPHPTSTSRCIGFLNRTRIHVTGLSGSLMDRGLESFFRSCCNSLSSLLYEVNLVTRDVRVRDRSILQSCC